MKYLCLVYGDENAFHDLPDHPPDAECLAYDVDLARTGSRVAAEALQPTRAATTVRVRGGDMQLTDGPFAETKEQLMGFYLIDVRDLNEAVRVAAAIPAARVGSVEVRPVRELDVGRRDTAGDHRGDPGGDASRTIGSREERDG